MADVIEHQGEIDFSDRASVLSARWKLDTGDAVGAAAMLAEIHEKNPDDVAILAELIGAYASFDSAKVIFL